MKIIATLYGLLFLTVVLGDITEDIPLLKKLEAIEDPLLENLPHAEKDGSTRTKRCAKEKNWCGKNEDCCCPMKCIYAWYNQQGSCQSTFMGLFKKC
uniref:Delta-Hexatoxin-Hf1e_1 n=1 Tax=Hadronyche formidabilis TaxID=426499 RepID=A0A4Q8K1B6_HADFO